MKKFRFTLEKLRRYKNQILEAQKNQLASLRSQQLAAEEELRQVAGAIAGADERFQADCSRGMTNAQITLAKNYLNAMGNQRRILNDSIRLFQEKIEAQIQVVVEATREVSMLDKLKEHQWEAYSKAAAKSEELFIEEYVGYKSAVATRQ